MPIGNLGDKISQDTKNRVKDIRNPPDNEPGFEEEETDGGFGDLFDDLDSFDLPTTPSNGGAPSSGVAGSIPFGNTPSAGGTPAGSIPGSTSLSGTMPVGNSGIPGLGAPNPFNPPGAIGQQQVSQPVEVKPDAFDKVYEASATAIGAIGRIIVQACKSIKNRTAEDWGYYSVQMMKVAAVMLGLSLLLTIFGIAGDLAFLKFFGFPFQLILAALTTLAFGCSGLGASALYIEAFRGHDINNIDKVEDIKPDMPQTQDEYEEDISSLLGDLFGGDDDDEEDDEDITFETSDTGIDDLIPSKFEDEDNEEERDTVPNIDVIPDNVPALNRTFLFDTFKPFFPRNTAGFADITEIDKGSDEYNTIETLCMKALASAGKMELEDATSKSSLESAKETYFTYELKLERIKGLNRLEDIEREMVAYFRESSDDNSVNCTVDLEGDFYRVTLNKGVSAVVTLGDIFQISKVEEFIKNPKNAIPIIAGISEDGQPVLTDAKFYDTMLIAGKPRSGKSWYVLCLMWVMMAFNTPDDVQFLIIDPKESNLFKTLALMPHVCGLHNDSNILAILKDVIDKEGARRKKLLADNRCENIWDLRRKGIEIPILYIVIDEVMTVIANLGANSKDFAEQMKVIVSQLPSQGIRLIFVPHRSQGVVDKTVRTNIGFTAAVRADDEVVCETLDIKKWTKPLLNPGDTALKMQGFGKEMLVHGPAVTTSDGENTDHIISVARAFYKMGVSIPDMSSIGLGFNRDIEHIKIELGTNGSSNKVQFDLSEADDIDLDNLE